MTRSAPDSCPGVLRWHQAADGPLVRIRIPGGILRPDQLVALGDAATDLGDGHLELTSRGNVQLRRVRDTSVLADRLDAADLLPAPTHERVRNIVATPLSGRVGGLADVRALAAALDEGLRARPELADLPGRVLFTLDDGRGDVSGLGADLGIHAVSGDDYALLLGGRDLGVRVPHDEAVDVLLAAAQAFQDLRGDRWRLREVDDGPARVAARLGFDPPVCEPRWYKARHDPPIGWFPQSDGRVALGAGVPLGSLPARTAEYVAAADRPVIVTPWRSLVLVDLDDAAAEQLARVLAPLGLVFDAASPWLQVTACAGKPGCAKSHTDVRGDVAAAIADGRLAPEPVAGVADGLAPEAVRAGGRQHWSGCERRCGRPSDPVTDIVAGPDGYRRTPPTAVTTTEPR